MIAIIAILAAILFPVFVQSKVAAKKTTCISGLHQMGLGLALYRMDSDDVNVRYRFCPDRVGDELCTNLANPTMFTGPQEVWWSPFDNSVPPDSAGPYPNYKAGMVAPYVKNLDIFKDPVERNWQVGYAMSYITAGPMGKPDGGIANPAALFVWDHRRTPGCADTRTGHTGPPWTPFPPDQDTAHTHYPDRHAKGLVTLRVDTSVKFLRPAVLKTSDFDADITP